MKYTLQVNQIAAHGIGIQDKIDLIDLCLFDAFKSFANSAKCEKMIDENGIWFWISYAEIIRELPLANIKTKDGIYRRMLKLRDAGLIIFHPNNQKVTKTFFQWGKNYDAMERTDWEEQPKDKKPKVVKDLRMKNRSTYGQETVAPTDEKPYNQTTINQTTKTKGERTPPAHNPSNLQSQKSESGLVAPAENPETVKAETPPSPNSAATPSPVECHWCKGSGKVFSVLHGRETCDVCDGTGSEPPAQFEVTAISSPTDLPGVTLVEAAPKIQPWEHPNATTPKELKTVLLRYADQNPENWRDNVLESGRATGMAKEKVEEYLSDFCDWQFKQDFTRGKLSQYTAGFSLWLKKQPRYDAMNAPKEGGQTRQNPPANYTSSTRH